MLKPRMVAAVVPLVGSAHRQYAVAPGASSLRADEISLALASEVAASVGAAEALRRMSTFSGRICCLAWNFVIILFCLLTV